MTLHVPQKSRARPSQYCCGFTCEIDLWAYFNFISHNSRLARLSLPSAAGLECKSGVEWPWNVFIKYGEVRVSHMV
jgi:hypothetical protein